MAVVVGNVVCASDARRARRREIGLGREDRPHAAWAPGRGRLCDRAHTHPATGGRARRAAAPPTGSVAPHSMVEGRYSELPLWAGWRVTVYEVTVIGTSTDDIHTPYHGDGLCPGCEGDIDMTAAALRRAQQRVLAHDAPDATTTRPAVAGMAPPTWVRPAWSVRPAARARGPLSQRAGHPAWRSQRGGGDADGGAAVR